VTRELPSFLRDLLAAPPRVGEGVHDWLYRVARNLHAHLPAVAIVNLLEQRVQGCGRTVTRKEIEDSVKNSFDHAWQPRHGATSPAPKATSKWPAVNHNHRAAISRDGGGLVDLWEHSKPRLDDSGAHAEEIIDRLFPGNPLLCCGKSSQVFDTRPRESWRGELAQLQLIVPSPMTAPKGLTKEGKESAHSLSNTGPRWFLICEFDTGTPDEHAAILLHLAGYRPMVCAVHSGNKSLHGWFHVQGQPEEKVLKFFQYAVTLGADSRLWTLSQFVRMPDGARENGRRQTVFFVNFKILEAEK
jgi:hypothetical protein